MLPNTSLSVNGRTKFRFAGKTTESRNASSGSPSCGYLHCLISHLPLFFQRALCSVASRRREKADPDPLKTMTILCKVWRVKPLQRQILREAMRCGRQVFRDSTLYSNFLHKVRCEHVNIENDGEFGYNKVESRKKSSKRY